MDSFKAKYLQECKNQHYEPSQTVLSALRESNKKNASQRGNHGLVLNFAGCNLSVVDCNLLAKPLSTDTSYGEYRFTDCLLTEDACKIILNALSCNKVIMLLDFKGNNLRESGAILIGKLLKRTTTLHELFLEWNTLGMWDSGVTAISEGLALNQSLRVLDLSNNQISHESGQQLAGSLKRNKTLSVLDMRWNNVGVLGGRAFLSAMEHNKYIINLQLQGNNIPSDILKAIGTALQRNIDYHAIFEEQQTMRRSLKQEIDHLQHEKSLQISTLFSQLEKEKELHGTFAESTRSQLQHLKKAAEDLKKENERLRENNSCFQVEIKTLNSKLEDSKNTVIKKDKELAEALEKFENELEKYKENSKIEQKERKKEFETKEQEVYSLQQRLRELNDCLEKEKRETASLENQISKIKKSHEEEISNILHKHKAVKSELNTENAGRIKNLQDKLTSLNEQKEKLEIDIGRFKSNLISEKLKYEEELMNLRTTFKQEEMMKSKQYEERLDLLVRTKDELQSKVSKLSIQLTESDTQLMNCQKELETNKRQYEQYQQLLNQRDLEHRNEMNRVRLETDSEKRVNSDLNNKIKNLESKSQDLESQLRELKSTKESEIVKLQEQLRNKEDEIKRIRDDELRRASILESALQTYISSARSGYK